MSRQSRRQANAFGRHAETLCAWCLRLKGWRIVARDFRTAVGEIDIAARRGRILAVIEVKARPNLESAGAAVSRRQQRRIANAALRLLQTKPALTGLDLRFDAMLVRPWRWPLHLADAWRPDA
jgi:putative endonuclease